jgi:hypothetical protein
MVTVAFRCISRSATGMPTMLDRPSTCKHEEGRDGTGREGGARE